MISDKLLINLKIISKIQKNGRIARSYEGIISLENDGMYQFIKRFISNDSRKQAIFEINSIITESLDTFKYILNSKSMNESYSETEEYQKNCQDLELLCTELKSARAGIENLKFTYKTDHNIISRIDIILLKIDTGLSDIENKLDYYKSFNTELNEVISSSS